MIRSIWHRVGDCSGYWTKVLPPVPGLTYVRLFVRYRPELGDGMRWQTWATVLGPEPRTVCIGRFPSLRQGKRAAEVLETLLGIPRRA